MKENNFINSDKIYLFHNNRCSKSREVKKYLDDNNIIYEVIDYLNTLPEESFLKSVLLKLESNFEEIICRRNTLGKSCFTCQDWLSSATVSMKWSTMSCSLRSRVRKNSRKTSAISFPSHSKTW